MDILVEQVKKGNNEAFSVLYKNNVNKIYALCIRMTCNKNTAKELTQDVFVRAWKKINSFKGESSFSTWIYRLAINVVVGKLKKEKLLDYREIDIADLEQSFHGEMNLHIEEKMDLENAISQLPEKSRMVLILHDIEGYKHKEVGSFLKISPGTSKAHLHRARNLLREYLK